MFVGERGLKRLCWRIHPAILGEEIEKVKAETSSNWGGELPCATILQREKHDFAYVLRDQSPDESFIEPLEAFVFVDLSEGMKYAPILRHNVWPSSSIIACKQVSQAKY